MKTANPNDNTNRTVVHLNFGFCATRTNRNGCALLHPQHDVVAVSGDGQRRAGCDAGAAA